MCLMVAIRRRSLSRSLSIRLISYRGVVWGGDFDVWLLDLAIQQEQF